MRLIEAIKHVKSGKIEKLPKLTKPRFYNNTLYILQFLGSTKDLDNEDVYRNEGKRNECKDHGREERRGIGGAARCGVSPMEV